MACPNYWWYFNGRHYSLMYFTYTWNLNLCYIYTFWLSKLAQLVMILTSIWEVHCSNPGKDTDYTDWYFTTFYIPLRQTGPLYFKFIIHNRPVIWHYITWVTDRIVHMHKYLRLLVLGGLCLEVWSMWQICSYLTVLSSIHFFSLHNMAVTSK